MTGSLIVGDVRVFPRRWDEPSLAVGAPAELLIVAGDTVTSAVMDHPRERIVIHHDRVVARDGVLAG